MKNYRKHVKKVNGKDRLSNLHDDILIHILSFVHVKSAAQTCVLSRRWNNKLWMHHPDVYLNTKTFDETSNKFGEFVDMVLTQHDKLHCVVRSFSFTWTFESNIPQQLLDKVHVYAQYHDVRHFDLSICCASHHRSYPSRKFNPKSLITLRLNLSNWYLRRSLCSDFNLKLRRLYLSGCNTLKTLWLEKIMIKFSSSDVDLFSGLVDLAELHIIGCYIVGKDGCFVLSAPRLERLTLLENTCKSYLDVPHWKISSPLLKYLRTDLCLSMPPINYVDELEIDLPSFEDCTARRARRVIDTITRLPHAKAVTLSKSTLQAISVLPDHELKGRLQFSHFTWEHLKVITTNELPGKKFLDYLQGLAYLTERCFKILKVEFL